MDDSETSGQSTTISSILNGHTMESYMSVSLWRVSKHAKAGWISTLSSYPYCWLREVISSQNLITTKVRYRLSGEHVDVLMRVMIEGPTNTEFDFNRALKDWRDRKTRIIFQWLFNNIHVMCICNHVSD